MPVYFSDGGSGIRLIPKEYDEAYLMHYRTEGSKNGIRLYQNKDGSLTPLGRIHYGIGQKRVSKLNENIENKKTDVKNATGMADRLMVEKHNIANYTDAESKKTYNLLDQTEKQVRDYVSRQNDNIGKMEAKRSKLEAELNSLKPKDSDETSKSLKSRIQSLYLPDNMVGKSKEEIKAWEQKEREKFEKESEKERQELEFGRKLEKFDKLNPSEQADVMREVESRLKSLNEKKNLTHEERKIQDGLSDWLQTEQKKKEPSKTELSEAARTEFNGDKDHDDLLYDVPKDIIKDRIELTKDWFNDEQYVTQEERVSSLKYLKDNDDKLNGSARKNFGDDLLSFLHEKSSEIDSKIWKDGHWNEKAFHELESTNGYKDYNSLSDWLTDQVYDKSGSWNACEFKRGSNADKASKAYYEASEKLSDLWDKVSKDTGYTMQRNYEKLKKAVMNTHEWTELSKAYDRAEGDLLGAMLKDIGFRDTPENRFILLPFAFID